MLLKDVEVGLYYLVEKQLGKVTKITNVGTVMIRFGSGEEVEYDPWWLRRLKTQPC